MTKGTRKSKHFIKKKIFLLYWTGGFEEN